MHVSVRAQARAHEHVRAPPIPSSLFPSPAPSHLFQPSLSLEEGDDGGPQRLGEGGRRHLPHHVVETPTAHS